MKYYMLPLIVLFACSGKQQTEPTEEYQSEINNWKQKRLTALKAENGYVNLAGLFWLQEGETTFGGSEDNGIVFPTEKTPSYLGSFIKQDSTIVINAIDTNMFMNDQKIIGQAVAFTSMTEKPKVFSRGSLQWIIIQRGDQIGVRLRDLEHPNLTSMEAIEYYPLNPEYRVIADYEPYDPPKMIQTTNVLGITYDAPIPGKLTFELKGKQYTLEPNIDEGDLHIRFKDATTGKETYGLGRYLKAEMPDGPAQVVVDFNKAYNPPCAFTEFATCPLPPEQNTIGIKVEAGEKTYGEH
ncbi:MAG: DUF1684 domain-containing protein [Cyclobacteriaceae bacterium]